MFATTVFRPLSFCLAVALSGVALGGCSLFGSSGGGGLAPGLTASMESPGAVLDKGEALNILNHYRATTGAPALSGDAALDATAQSLAVQYANSGTPPKLPAGARAIRISAGYSNFAETFSGWRNSPDDAAVLADAGAHRAGLGVFYSAASNYGVYWVLVLGE